MESTLIWLIAVVLIAAVFTPYLIRFRRDHKAALVRLEEARSLGIDRPRGQHPQVNRSLCIGCGSCVAACPEGDILAVVWGKAEVINGDRCVGHGLCETACPVGALKVGLGDIRSRPDIPVLSEHHETSVPDIFIAGELSGISLIRHAVAQGQLVVREIARRYSAQPHSCDYNVVVVGAGPAGLSAALAARERGLSCVVLEQYDVGGAILHYPRCKLVMTQPVEIPSYGALDRDEYSKEQLLELWQDAVSRASLNVRPGWKVESIGGHADGFAVRGVGGETITGQYLILAMGRRGTPRKLGVPGEELSKVLYQLVDAQSYTNQHVLVVGGGDSAIEAAIGLARQRGNTVTISYRKDRFFRIKRKNEDAIGEMLRAGELRGVFSSQVQQIRPASVVLTTPSGEIELPNDYVIVQAGGIPPFAMLKQAGIRFGGDSLSVAETDRQLAGA